MTARSRLGSRWRVLVLLLVGAALLSGCAQIPTGGPVRSGRGVGYNEQDSYVRALPAPPRPGAPPAEIVKGFLEASASFEDGYAVARQFLTPSASQGWDPGTGITVYAADSFMALTLQHNNQVTFDAHSVASINDQGVYNPAPPQATVHATFTLARVGGQWRISNLPDGVYLTDIDVSRAYLSVDVYFLDPTGQVLVPDPIFLPRTLGMSTALVKRLLSGPSGWLRPAVTTAFPVGTAVAGSVPVVNGVAEVDLTEAALSASPKNREALSAQLVWTLSQLGDVQAVRITVGGAPFSVSGAPAVQPVDSWRGFDPAALPSDAVGYAVRGGRLGSLSNGQFSPLKGPAGAGRLPLVDPAIDPRAQRLALLSSDRSKLLVGPIGGTPTEALHGTSLSAPSWDNSSQVWVSDSKADGTSTVWQVRANGAAMRVSLPKLGAQTITAVRVSRDGTRVALVTQVAGVARLYVGAVAAGVGPSEPPQIVGLRWLDPALTTIRQVTWSTADQLAVLGAVGAEPEGVYIVGLDGQLVVSEPSQPGTVAVAAAPNQPIMIATKDGQVYQLAGRRWVAMLTEASSPFYPG